MEVIMKLARERYESAPFDAFYTPEEWRARGEKYGALSVLVVVHDGGPYAPLFNYDYEDYKAIEAMQKALEPLGLYAEQCTGWYSAIYRR
jgi:hypothetical protein